MKKYLLILVTLLLSACASITYTGHPDGSTKVEIYTLGSDSLLRDLHASIDKQGERKVDIGSIQGNQTKGMAEINQGLSLIIEGLAKGAIQ